MMSKISMAAIFLVVPLSAMEPKPEYKRAIQLVAAAIKNAYDEYNQTSLEKINWGIKAVNGGRGADYCESFFTVKEGVLIDRDFMMLYSPLHQKAWKFIDWCSARKGVKRSSKR